MFIDENGGFRKLFPEWKLLKTQVYRFSVPADGKNGAFQKRLRHNSLSLALLEHAYRTEKNVWSEPGDKSASLDHRLDICFRVTKNGGFQKRISVDMALKGIKKKNEKNCK